MVGPQETVGNYKRFKRTLEFHFNIDEIEDPNPSNFQIILDDNNFQSHNNNRFQIYYKGKSISANKAKEIEKKFIEENEEESFFKCKMHGGACWNGTGKDHLFKNVKYHIQKYLFRFVCFNCKKEFKTTSTLYTHFKKHL